MRLDPDLLLQFLDQRRRYARPAVGAVYDGLAARVRRGDFNKREEGERG